MYAYYLTPEMLQLLANQICRCYHCPKMIETILSMCYAINNKCRHWDPILAAVSILNTFVVHDLNGLDAYTLCTVHEQDPVMARHERRNYTCAIACML